MIMVQWKMNQSLQGRGDAHLPTRSIWLSENSRSQTQVVSDVSFSFVFFQDKNGALNSHYKRAFPLYLY